MAKDFLEKAVAAVPSKRQLDWMDVEYSGIIHFGMNTSAHFISFAAGDTQFFSHAVVEVVAVLSASGSAVVACGNDFIVAHDDGAILTAQTGRTMQDSIGDVQVVVDLIGATTIHRDTSEND